MIAKSLNRSIKPTKLLSKDKGCSVPILTFSHIYVRRRERERCNSTDTFHDLYACTNQPFNRSKTVALQMMKTKRRTTRTQPKRTLVCPSFRIQRFLSSCTQICFVFVCVYNSLFVNTELQDSNRGRVKTEHRAFK